MIRLIFIILFVCVSVVLTAQPTTHRVSTQQAPRELYSSVASAQVRQAVYGDSVNISSDTLLTKATVPFQFTYRTMFAYKQFTILIVRTADEKDVLVYSGRFRVMLRPDDEYDILEKLMPLIK